MALPKYTIEIVESAPFGQNSLVLWQEGRTDAIVFDPGFDTRSILGLLEANGLRLAAILNTHGHVDHIAGNAALKESYPDAPLVIGRNESAGARRRRDQSQPTVRNLDHQPPTRSPRG